PCGLRPSIVPRTGPEYADRPGPPTFPPWNPRAMHDPQGSDIPDDPAVAQILMWRVEGSRSAVQRDELAVEDPLEIRLAFDQDGRRVRRGISVTMRTPGHDDELAVGFLFTEGILDTPGQVAKVEDWGPGNVVRVELNPGVAVDLARLERHF